MSSSIGKWNVLFFCLKFIAFVIVLVVLWWWLILPHYANFLLQSTGMTLKYLFKMPIESGAVAVAGVLNTQTTLGFVINGHKPTMSVALLVTNLPPYIALVLATAGLAVKRRVLILLYGSAILCFFHYAFIVMAMYFFQRHDVGSEIPTAVVQFFLTLPFMLWIVFAYWNKLTSVGNDTPDTAHDTSTGAEDTDETLD